MFLNDSDTAIYSGEPALLLHYLCPTSVTVASIEKYQKAIHALGLYLTQQDQTILNFTLRYPKFISIIDGGLSLFKPQSNLKKRFIVAASIVESSPQSFDMFLNSNAVSFPKWQLVQLGIRAIFIFIAAFLVFKLKGWK